METFTLSKPQLNRIMADHLHQIHDPAYAAGYLSAQNNNPHTFPTGLNREMLLIAHKPTRLTVEDKTRLKELREQLEATEWSRWSNGHHKRNLFVDQGCNPTEPLMQIKD